MKRNTLWSRMMNPLGDPPPPLPEKPTDGAAESPENRCSEPETIQTASGIVVELSRVRRVAIYGTHSKGRYRSTVKEAMTRQAVLGNPLFVLAKVPGVSTVAREIATEKGWPVEMVVPRVGARGGKIFASQLYRLLGRRPEIALVFPGIEDKWSEAFLGLAISQGISSLTIPVEYIEAVATEIGSDEPISG